MKKKCLRGILLLALVCLLLGGFRARALNRCIRVGFSAGTPPFQFLQEDGSYAGIHIDIMRAIAKADRYDIEFFLYENDRACQEALQNGEIDIVLGEVLSAVEDLEDVSISDSITSSQLCMIVSDEAVRNGSLSRTAVCVSENIHHTLLANLNFHQFISVGNEVQLYQRHLEQPALAMIGIKDSLIYQLEQDGIDQNYTLQYNYLGTVEFVMVLRGSDRELLRAMNDSINRFKATAEYEEICSSWLPSISDEARLRQILKIVLICAAVAALLSMVYVILSRRIQRTLHRQVAQQTEEILQVNCALEQQNARLQDESDLRNRIIKYSPSGMLLLDPDGMVSMMNKSACAIAGVQQPILGTSAEEVPVFREILQKEGPRLFQKGAMIDRSTLRIGDSPLRIRVYSYMIHQIIRDGAVTGVLLTVQDVTEEERRQQEEFERQKSSALTRIAAGIAHEIRNPLMTIRTFASLIEEKGDNKQVQESFARYVPDEVDRINRLIDNLIHYAKPSDRHPEKINVETLVGDSLALIRPVLRKSNFRLSQTLEPELFIFVDRDQTKQVLVNILLNSIEAMEQKSRAAAPQEPLTLAVDTRCRENKAVITIQDEGTGMTEQELAACRDPFFTTKQTGTGLGLSLCEQYIRENNGIIEIESIKNVYTKISLIFERS